jgi:hypothetical protein
LIDSGGPISLKHLTAGTLVTVCTFVTHAAAKKNELSGILGRTLISDQSIPGAPSYDPELRFGKGLTFELNYARHLMGGDLPSLSLEVPFVVNIDEDLHAAQNVIPKQYSSYFITPVARLNMFPNQAVSPWVSIGRCKFHTRVWRVPEPWQGWNQYCCISSRFWIRCEGFQPLQPAR